MPVLTSPESLLSVNLATVCVESTLYGIFVTLLFVSMYISLCRRRGEDPIYGTRLSDSWKPRLLNPMFIATILLMITITGHWVLTVIRLFDAFVNFDNGQNPIRFYANLSHPTETVKTALVVISIVITDAIIIYRLWIVWTYNYYVIIFPICTLLGLCACGIGAVYQLAHTSLGDNFFTNQAGRWIKSDCVFTLCTNIYSTALIAWKILTINKETISFGKSPLTPALAFLAESAALYSAYAVFFLVTYNVDTNLQFTAIDTASPIIGITFMMINVRVGLGWALKANSEKDMTIMMDNGPSTCSLHRRGTNLEMPQFSVTVTHVFDTDAYVEIEGKSAPENTSDIDRI